MSYCVNCGVELDVSAHACPLCGTPVVNPRCPVDETAQPPFPLRKGGFFAFRGKNGSTCLYWEWVLPKSRGETPRFKKELLP